MEDVYKYWLDVIIIADNFIEKWMGNLYVQDLSLGHIFSSIPVFILNILYDGVKLKTLQCLENAIWSHFLYS